LVVKSMALRRSLTAAANSSSRLITKNSSHWPAACRAIASEN
jgi:hypothetical protein